MLTYRISKRVSELVLQILKPCVMTGVETFGKKKTGSHSDDHFTVQHQDI